MMVDIPQNEVTEADLHQWFHLQAELKSLKAKEMLLRSKIFKSYFPDPKEGTNNFTMPDGYVLKGKHVINRSVDIGAFQALRQSFLDVNINSDALIKWTPELKIKEYRELTAEQAQLFDQCLIVKPGSPSLEIAQPAKGKKAT